MFIKLKIFYKTLKSYLMNYVYQNKTLIKVKTL